MKDCPKKRNPFFVLIPILSVVLLLSGCGFKDIDKRVFVVGFGIDGGSEEKPYKITLKMAIPGKKDSPKPEYTYLTQEADTIAKAIRLSESNIDKELEFGHAKVIVLGEDVFAGDIRS